jgi:hypothetical protein
VLDNSSLSAHCAGHTPSVFNTNQGVLSRTTLKVKWNDECCAVVIYACQGEGLLKESKQWRSSSLGAGVGEEKRG